MNSKRWLGIVYSKLKSVQSDSILIYKPVPAPIDKIKNKYRWRMIVKCRVNTKVLDIIKYSIEDDGISKMKETSIVVDVGPSSLM